MQMLKWLHDSVTLSLAAGVPDVQVCSDRQAIF